MKSLNMRVAVFIFVACIAAMAQDAIKSTVAYLPNQTARIHHVQLRPVLSGSPAASLAVLLQAAFHDPEICCEKGSALQHDLETFNTSSLQAVGDRVKGRRLLQGGRWITVDVEYVEEPSVTAAVLVGDALQSKLVLMEWNDHVYLLKSVMFDETRYNDGSSDYVIREMVLLDPQSKARNHEVTFDRHKDNWGKIKSLLTLTAQKD